jgi:hypothetical protein
MPGQRSGCRGRWRRPPGGRRPALRASPRLRPRDHRPLPLRSSLRQTPRRKRRGLCRPPPSPLPLVCPATRHHRQRCLQSRHHRQRRLQSPHRRQRRLQNRHHRQRRLQSPHRRRRCPHPRIRRPRSRPRPRSWDHDGRWSWPPTNRVWASLVPPRTVCLVISGDLYYNMLPRDRHWNSNPRPR